MNMLGKLRRKCKGKKGFTLVELIVVIVIILILAAVLVPSVLKYVNQAKAANCKADAATLLSQIQADYASAMASKGTFTNPGTISGIEVSADTADKTAAGKNHAYYTLSDATTDDEGNGIAYQEISDFVYNNGAYVAEWHSTKVGEGESAVAAGWTVTKVENK